MKITALLLALALTSVSAFAQEESDQEIKTLFGKKGKQTIGGYGALSSSYGKVNDLDAIFMGARGAVVINHSLALGLGGSGFMSQTVSDPFLNEEYEFAGGYGGFIIEPIIGARNPIHVSFPMLIGAGGIGYINQSAYYQDNNNNNYENYESYDEDSEAFFVFEPGIELEFNLVKFMRIAVTGSYCFTSNINLQYRETVLDAPYEGDPIGANDMLRGYRVGLIMKFGKF